jgi:hypothetical protein
MIHGADGPMSNFEPDRRFGLIEFSPDDLFTVSESQLAQSLNQAETELDQYVQFGATLG